MLSCAYGKSMVQLCLAVWLTLAQVGPINVLCAILRLNCVVHATLDGEWPTCNPHISPDMG